ncbi:MAG: hypothetical protein JW909_07910 [Planctomycetes bacterium]|nr:hypothetical protein [Planctomycetota bacterium]
MKSRNPEALRLENDYLSRLQAALASIRSADADEILQDVRQHIEDALSEIPAAEVSLVQMAGVIESLGPPESIAHGDAPAPDVSSAGPSRSMRRVSTALVKHWPWLAMAALFLIANVWLVRHLLQLIEKERVPEGRLVVIASSPDKFADPETAHAVQIEFGAPLDPASISDDSIRLTPPVPGRVLLENDRFLTLLLSEPLSCATRYRVDISGTLRGRRRESAPDHHFYFSTSGLSVTEVVQSGIGDDDSAQLTFVFNLPVLPDELARHLVLTYPDGTSADFEPVGGVASTEVGILIPNVRFGKLTAVISAGLKSTAGPLPLSEDLGLGWVWDQPAAPAVVETVNVAPTLEFASMSARFEGSTPAIEVCFNTEIDLSTAASHVKINPRVEFTLDHYYRGFRILGDFDPTACYTVTVRKGLSSRSAGILLQDVTRRVFFPDRYPSLNFAFGGGYLSPENMLKIPLCSVNLDRVTLRAQRLYESNIVEYAIRDSSSLSHMTHDLSTPVCERELRLENKRNTDVETLLDLRDIVGPDARGVFGLQVQSHQNWWRRDHAIAVVTDLGISARLSHDKAFLWITSIRTSSPVEGAAVSVYSDRRQKLGSSVSRHDGTAIVDLADTPAHERPALAVVSTGSDLSYLDLTSTLRYRGSAASSGRPYLYRGYELMSFADRGAYRPQDTVRLSAFIRGPSWQTPPPMPVQLTVLKPDGREFLSKTVLSDASGRLLADFEIPPDAMTGRYSAGFSLPGSDDSIGKTSFIVAEYIPQTLRMSLALPPDPLSAKEPLEIAVAAQHLFGDPARGLNVRCRARFSGTGVAFPGDDWKDFSFGDSRVSPGRSRVELPQACLDEAGRAVFTLNVPTVSTPAAVAADVEVEVLEPGGRALVEQACRTMHYWPQYVGIKKPDKVQAGEPASFDIALVKPGGSLSLQPGRYRASLYRIMSSYVYRRSGSDGLRYEWITDENFIASAEGDFLEGRASPEITIGFPGRHRLVVESGDSCPVTVEFYARGEGTRWEFADPDELLLTLDKPLYRPGDTALLAIRAPFDGTALVTLEKDTVIRHFTVPVKDGSADCSIPVDENLRPNAFLTATLIRPVAAEKDWMPHRASGVARLDIDCSDRKLILSLTSPQDARPGGTLDLQVAVTQDGKPVPRAAVVLAAVDEGVLALTGYATPSPFDFFYAARRLDIREYDMFSRLAPVLAAWEAEGTDTPGGGSGSRQPSDLGADLGRRLSTIRSRRVRTAVLYRGALVADDNGLVRADFTVPEYVGELRVMAFAASAGAFGSSHKALPVKSPLMTRASWPRFLAPGDTFSLPVTVFNRTGADGDVSLTFQLHGPIQTLEKLPLSVFVAAGREETSRVLMKATGVGTASARIVSSLAGETYAESVELPVRPAAGFARKGSGFTVDAGTGCTVQIPGGFLDGTELCSLTIAASPAVELAGSIDYLLSYPYGCAEQTTSRLVPLVYLRDLAELTVPGALGEAEIDRILQAGFLRLWRMQTHSGGLSYWPGSKNPSPWGSLYAADVLLEARKAGHAVPSGLLDPLLDYLRRKVGDWASSGDIGYACYACHVLARAGTPPVTWMATLDDRIRTAPARNVFVPSTARVHLASAYLCTGETEIAKETASPALPSAQKRMSGGYLDSPVRELSCILLTLLDADPDSPRIPMLADSLRRKTHLGRWGTTQENAFALMALGKLARRQDTLAGSTLMLTLPDGSTRTADAARGLRVDKLPQGGSVVVNLQGQGRVYGFSSAEGVPVDGLVEEKDSGIAARRVFLDPQNGSTVAPDSLEQGRLYVVRLAVDSAQALDNIVIMDLLPAGMEIENPQLQGAAAVGASVDSLVPDGPAGPAEDALLKLLRTVNPYAKIRLDVRHVERRDDRIIVFGSVRPGLNVFDYAVRAVTPGEYVLPPVEASCMYDPDLFSVYGRGKLVVKP